MSEKIIKSVTLIKDLPGLSAPCELEKGGDDQWGTWSSISYFYMKNQIELLKYPEWFQIEYEPEIKPIRYYPNGSAYDLPANGTVGWSIVGLGKICRRYYDRNLPLFQYILKNQGWFITLEACEKWLDVLNTHNRLLRTIMDINTENNWIADWSDGNQQKFILCWSDENEKIDYDISHRYRYATIYMSRQAMEYMMSDAVSESDRKKFLFIID